MVYYGRRILIKRIDWGVYAKFMEYFKTTSQEFVRQANYRKKHTFGIAEYPCDPNPELEWNTIYETQLEEAYTK